MRFSGDRALALEADFVQGFPHRHSGMPNNRRAVTWLRQRFEALGLVCEVDGWKIVNFSRPVELRNLVCRLEGGSGREIVLVAHHDHSPATVQGADNDGSGIAILLHLAEIFAGEPRARHALSFVSSDAEEYGMIGARRLVATHPDPGRLVAGISLDNLGKRWTVGIDLAPTGQFRGYGPLWLQLAAREAARAAGDLPLPTIRPPIRQVLDQAVPVSFMDQGPLVASGVAAVGLMSLYDPAATERVWATYHTPEDRLEHQSPEALHLSGRVAEALVRQLQGMATVPEERGPYLYFDGSGGVLRGLPLWLLFLAVPGLFLAAAIGVGGASPGGRLAGWRAALPHFSSLWLPLFAAALAPRLLVRLGLMDAYDTYPALARDPAIFHPRWPAVAVLLGTLALLLLAGRWAARRWGGSGPAVRDRRSLALLVVGLAGLYLVAINPFSLLFLLPALAWIPMGGRRGAGRLVDGALFLLGGAFVWLLVWHFGFVVLRNGLAVLWYLLMMFSIGMIGAATSAVIAGTLAAGLSILVPPPE